MKIFVTGSAGFIGFHLAKRLLADGHEVTGYDGLTPYYDVALKRRRLALLQSNPAFIAVEAMLEDRARLEAAVVDSAPDVIIHLAAQAGVRYSVENPGAYVSANLVGSFNLLEAAKAARPRHLLFASTSSVYGGNVRTRFAEADRTDFPVSLYAATKKANEAMTHAYAHLWDLPTTCFRFFTVYGPWGRPDMALFKFVAAIERGEPIEVYGEGRMRRDFTYIDDLIEAIIRLIEVVPVSGKPVQGGFDSLSPVAPWRVVNIAGGEPMGLMPFIDAIELALGRKAQKRLLPMQPGDLAETASDPQLLRALVGSLPHTSVTEGVAAFVEWYRKQYA